MNIVGELRKQASLLAQEAPPLLAGEFPSHAFPTVLLRYAQTLSETFRIPPAMFLVTMLGAVSAAAGKGWRLMEAAPGMSNYVNLYIVMALEPGSFKSIAGRIMRPIAEEESRRIVEWEQQQAPVLRAHVEGAKADVKRAAKLSEDASLEADARRKAECERKLLRNPRLLLGSWTTSALAQSLARGAYNSAVAWINGSHADLRPWLVRYREHCCRVALNLQIASDPISPVLTPEAALQAVCVVHWVLAQLVEAQLVEAVHSNRTGTLRERIGEFASLVPVDATSRCLQHQSGNFTLQSRVWASSCRAVSKSAHHHCGRGGASSQRCW